MQKSYNIWIIAFLSIILASITFYQVVTAVFSENEFSSLEQVQQFIQTQPEVTMYKDFNEKFEGPIPENEVHHTYAVFNNHGKKIKFIWLEFEDNKKAKEYYLLYNQRFENVTILNDLERTFFDDYSYRTLILPDVKIFCYQNKKWVMIMEGENEEVTNLWNLYLKTL